MAPKYYAGKILLADLTNETTKDIALDEKIYENFIGGKGLATKILCDSEYAINPKINPLSEDNAVIIMSGALNPYFPKFAMTSKSPLTNTIFASISGGCRANLGSYLRTRGYDGLIIKGAAKDLTELVINDRGIFFKKADNLKSKTISETEEQLKEEFKGDYKKYSTLIIGPAGEKINNNAPSMFASVYSDGRFFGRGGLGAVLGSKNIKAILVSKGEKQNTLSKEFNEALRGANKDFRENQRTQDFREEGTSSLFLKGLNSGFTPVENYKLPSKEDIEKYANLSGESFAKKIVDDKNLANSASCRGCSLLCGKIIKTNGKEQKRPEYETIANLGPNLGISDDSTVEKLAHLCDDYGLDTISTGGVLGFAMAVRQYATKMKKEQPSVFNKNKLMKKFLKTFPLEFGKTNNLEEAVRKIAYREDYGIELAEGVKRMSDKYGHKSFSMQVKGLEMSAYVPDYRTLGQTLSYLINPRGACHLLAPIGPDEIDMFAPLEYDNIKGKAEVVAFMEETSNMMDSMGACRFTAKAFIKKILNFISRKKIERFSFANFPKLCLNFIDIGVYHNLLSVAAEKKYSKKKFLEIGKKISMLEHKFNREAGHDIEHETLPESLLQNLSKNKNMEKSGFMIEEMLKRYFALRK